MIEVQQEGVCVRRMQVAGRKTEETREAIRDRRLRRGILRNLEQQTSNQNYITWPTDVADLFLPTPVTSEALKRGAEIGVGGISFIWSWNIICFDGAKTRYTKWLRVVRSAARLQIRPLPTSSLVNPTILVLRKQFQNTTTNRGRNDQFFVRRVMAFAIPDLPQTSAHHGSRGCLEGKEFLPKWSSIQKPLAFFDRVY
jgi:hypothetical protein